MVRNIFILTLVSVSAILLRPSARGESVSTGRYFNEFHLVKDADGLLVVSKAVAELGMSFGLGFYGGDIRLTPELSKKLMPLAHTTGDPSSDFCGIRLFAFKSYLKGSVALERVPRILVSGRLRWSLAEGKPKEGQQDSPSSHRSHRVGSVRISHVEFLPEGWLKACRELDQVLEEIVIASLAAPSEEKRRKLAAAIEKGSKALNAMAATGKAEDTEEQRRLVNGVAPKSRIVNIFKDRTRGRWGGEFRRYVSLLRIQPKATLPAEPAACPLLKLLLEAESAQSFAERVRADCSENALDVPLFYVGKLRRVLHGWQVPELNPEELRAVRKQAAFAMKKRERASKSPEPYVKETHKASRLVVRTLTQDLDADLMAERMILGGLLVEKLLPGEPDWGLREGDVILDYRCVYELATQRQFAKMNLGLLLTLQSRPPVVSQGYVVLRGDQLIQSSRLKRGPNGESEE